LSDEKSSEPTPYTLWEQNRATVLLAKQEKEDQLRATVLKQATAEITAFYTQRQTTFAAAKARIRAEEKDTIADLDRVMRTGATWQKVGRLINLAPRASTVTPAAAGKNSKPSAVVSNNVAAATTTSPSAAASVADAGPPDRLERMRKLIIQLKADADGGAPSNATPAVRPAVAKKK